MGLPPSSPGLPPAESLWDKAFGGLDETLKASLGKARTNKRDVLAAVLRAAEDKRSTSLQKRWKFKLPNEKVVIVRDVLEKITRWVVRFREIGDVAAQFDPAHASLQWAAVRFLLQTTVNDIEQYGAMVLNIEVITRLITCYKEFELLYCLGNSPIPSPLDDALTSLYAEVLTYLARTIDILSEKTLVQPAKAPFRIGDEEQMQRILKREDEVAKLAKLNDTEMLHSLETPLVRLVDQASISNQILDDERRAQMIRWLSTSAYSTHHESITETRVPNFGQWLLQHGEYKDWCQSSSPSILLVMGIPGSGKTHLCSAVVDELLKTASSQALSAPFSYFYCSKTDSEPERSSVDEILRSILRQLTIADAGTQPRVRCFLDNEFEHRSKSARLSGLDLPKLKRKDCVDLIIELVNDDPITIILDAIDQVQDAQRVHLLDELNRILSQAANVVKIFLTSRNDAEVLSSFPSAKILSITSANVRGDMQDFIHRELNSARLMNGCISSQVRKDLTDAILSGAGEMFLWAWLQIQQLRMRKIGHEEDLLPALRANILSDLDQIYGEILRQVLIRGDSSRSFVIHIFAWLLYMKSPLTMSALLAAMSLTSANAATLQPAQVSEMCAHLVVTDSRRDTIEFAHHSTREYLLRTQQDLFSPFLSHSLLASDCIDICSRGLADGQPLEGQTTSIYVYSTIYWAMHFKDSGVTRRERELFLHMLSFIADEDEMTASLAFETWMDKAAELVALLPNHHPMKATLDDISNDQSSPIFLAAVFGLDGLLEFLAESDLKTDWNQRNRAGHTAVYLAAAMGHASTLPILIDQGANVNVECGKYGSPLHAACYRGHEQVVIQLLSHNASSTCGRKFKNALDACARGDHEKIAVILVQSGVINTQADYEHALQAAAEFGFISLLNELQPAKFNHFSNGDMVDKQRKRTTKAIKGGQLGVLQRFLSRAVKPSTILAPCAVATAATYGHNHIIHFLLDIGMDIEAKGEFGTPLRSACLMGRTSTVRLLLEHGAGAKPDSLDIDALHTAAAKGHYAIVRLLIEAGADVKKSCRTGDTFKTALEGAAYNGHEGVVGILVDAGADVHAQGTFRDAFHAAAEGGREEIVLWFLKRGYRFRLPSPSFSFRESSPPRFKNSRFARGEDFPLEASAAEGQVSVVRLLLDQRWYLGITGRAVVGAIEAAAARGHVEVLELLLRSRAMAQRGIINKDLLLLVKSAGESRNPSMIRLAVDFASHHGIAADQINSLQSQWPPSAEKYRVAFVDKGQLQQDFIGACDSGDEDGVCSIIDCRYGPLLDHGDFTQAIKVLSGAGNEALLKIMLGHMRRMFPLHPLVSDDSCNEAAKNNHVNVLRLLLSQRGHTEDTPILLGRLACIACRNAHVDMIRYLVEELKLDVNTEIIEDTSGDVPFVDASADKQQSREGRRTSLLQVALRAFKKPDYSCPRCVHRALMNMDEDTALRTDVVTCILANGADPSCLGGQDAFPLSVAVEICPEIVIRKLIEAGADATSRHEGNSAMDAAMARDWPSARIVQMILEAGGTLPVTSEKGQLLMERVAKSMAVDYLRGAKREDHFPPCLVEAEPKPPYIRESFQKMPDASEKVFKDEMGPMLDLLELFLRRYSDQKTDALHYAVFLEVACRLGRQELVEMLLSRGVDANGSGDCYGTPIQVAAGYGQRGIVQLLLEHGVRMHGVKGRRNSALGAAIAAGHSDIVNLLLAHGADPNSKPEIPNLNGTTRGPRHSSLRLAIETGHISIVNALLKAGAVVNEDDGPLAHPLILACEKGSIDIVTTLIQAGAPLNVAGKNYIMHRPKDASPLHAAIDGGHVQIIELLLENGADVNMHVHIPALVAAVWKGDLHIVQRLLVAGANINHVSLGSRTALFEAVERRDFLVVRELLAKTAVAAGSGYPNCLFNACRKASVDIIELLLENIFDNHDQPEKLVDEVLVAQERRYRPKDWDVIQRLLLDYVPPTQQRFAYVCSLGSVSMAVSMLDAGISVDGQDHQERPIHMAVRNLRPGVARILVQRGADISFKSPEWGAPLLCALLSCAENFLWDLKSDWDNKRLTKLFEHDHSLDVRLLQSIHECEAIVQLLIENGADLDDNSSGFGKPFHIACLIGSTAIIATFLNSGADVNAVNGYFATSLFAAIYGRHFDVVCLLLKEGADVNYMHLVHGTPLHFACAVNDGAITRELLHHGASMAALDQAGDTALTIALRACKSTANNSKRFFEESSLFTIIRQMPQSIRVTEQDILAAARIHQGADILASLLEINKQMLVSEGVIVHLLESNKNPDTDTLKLLFQRSGGLGITERMLMTAPSASTLEALAECLPVCRVNPAILEIQNDFHTLELLLNISDIVDITEAVVVKALGLAGWHARPESKPLILEIIWRHKPNLVVTQPMLIAAGSPENLESLLKRLVPTSGMLNDVALFRTKRKWGFPAHLFCLLLRYDKDKETQLDPGMILNVLSPLDPKHLDEFLTHRPDLLIPEELFLDVFKVCVSGPNDPRIKLLEILLKHGKKPIFTQNIRNAIDSEYYAPEDMTNKQRFYSLRERDETVAEAEVKSGEEDCSS